jgi:hypothetical protein
MHMYRDLHCNCLDSESDVELMTGSLSCNLDISEEQEATNIPVHTFMLCNGLEFW